MPQKLKQLDDNRLATFWYFVNERQSIYWKRQAGARRPWTRDAILQNHFFCNVYRELDRGTQYVIQKILVGNKHSEHIQDTLFKVMLYRLFNQPHTYEFLQKPLDGVYFNGREAGKILDRKKEAGIRVFRGAWMTSGARVTTSKAAAYCLAMEKVSKRRDVLCREFFSQFTMEGAWEVICGVKWFGGFSAYQVVLDLSYVPWVRERWTDYDTWVYPGPGAKLGLMWLCGEQPVKRKGSGSRTFLSEEECREMIYHLRDEQDSYFNRYKMKFHRWQGLPLDLHNIEFSLCEFNKYMRAQHGGKKKKFIPSDEQLNLITA